MRKLLFLLLILAVGQLHTADHQLCINNADEDSALNNTLIAASMAHGKKIALENPRVLYSNVGWYAEGDCIFEEINSSYYSPPVYYSWNAPDFGHARYIWTTRGDKKIQTTQIPCPKVDMEMEAKTVKSPDGRFKIQFFQPPYQETDALFSGYYNSCYWQLLDADTDTVIATKDYSDFTPEGWFEVGLHLHGKSFQWNPAGDQLLVHLRGECARVYNTPNFISLIAACTEQQRILLSSLCKQIKTLNQNSSDYHTYETFDPAIKQALLAGERVIIKNILASWIEHKMNS